MAQHRREPNSLAASMAAERGPSAWPASMAAERAAPPRIPATILTGYAGAGKSHVVNLLLAEAARRKLRVAKRAARCDRAQPQGHRGAIDFE